MNRERECVEFSARPGVDLPEVMSLDDLALCRAEAENLSLSSSSPMAWDPRKAQALHSRCLRGRWICSGPPG